MLEIILAFFIYFGIVFFAHYVTEVKRLPQWLQFPPFHCRKCLTFWTNMFVFLIIGLTFNLYWLMGVGITLGILTAIAMHYDQKNKTIKVSDFK